MAAPALRFGGGRGAPPRGAADLGVDLVRAFQLLRRRLRLALLVAAVLTAAAAAVVLRLPDRFTAEALVILNDRPSKLSELQSPTASLLSRTQADLSVVKTETEIMTSDALLRAVAERLDLAHDPAFSPPPKPPGAAAALVARARAYVAGLTGGAVGGGGGEAAPPPAAPSVDDAVERLSRAVEVVNEGSSYALRIRVETGDRDLSARIANALADAYLTGQRDQQRRLLESGSAWLSDRLGALRAAVLKADEAVERFRAENQLGQADLPSLLESKITQLNSALIDAGARLSRAQANLAEAESATRRGGDLASAGSVLAAPSIQALRQQEADILVRRGALQKQYGPQHPQVAEVQAQLDATQARIRLEVERIVAGLRSEANATRGEVQNLQRQLSDLEARRSQQADQQVRLADLDREAKASREVYAQLLQQFNTATAQESGQQPDARLAAPARPPLDPSSPRRKLLLIGAAIASLGAGALLALVVGYLRGGFGGAEPLEEATGLPTLETLPELGRREVAGLLGREALPEAADPVRGLAFTLEGGLVPGPEGAADGGGGAGRVILLTSSVAGEGKTLLALTLARTFAFAGRRVLLVDLDPWRPSLGGLLRRLPLERGEGREAAGMPVATDPASGLDVAARDRPTPAAERPAAIRRAVEALPGLRRAYDVVLLDAPPVLAIPDVLHAAAHADGTLMVVRFEGPGASTVRAALAKLAGAGANVVGTVLSRVDARNYRRYGYGALAYTSRGR